MKSFRIILAFLAAACITACGGGKEKASDPVTLTADCSELVFETEGGTVDVTLTSGVKPSIICRDSWITVSEGPFSANKIKISVSAAAYDGASVRTGRIYVSGEKQSLEIPVTQNPRSVPLEVDMTSASFDMFGGERTFTVVSSTRPSISADVRWIGFEQGEINDSRETVVKLLAGPNRTDGPRRGTVTVSCGGENLTIDVSEEACSIPVASAPSLTPQLVFDSMQMGWNMGNHMDAVSNGVANETVWGNPKCTQATFDGVKAAGFSSVRICVTWAGHIGPAPAYKLDESWLGRVEEIVGYAENAGLVAIINTHHDESYWLDIKPVIDNTTLQETTKDQIFSVWSQIAMRFRDKGDWLVMESFNEIQDGGWGWSDSFRANPNKQYRILNEWNQTFVDAVRCTGGANATRWLGIPGYAANPGFTISGLTLPKDYTDGNRLIVAVHDYDPYNYTLSNPLVRQWGHTADPDKRVSDRDEQNVVEVFDRLKAAYLDRGIPVYIGEMGCSRHPSADFAYQKYYMEYFCKAAADRMLPMYVWDNGASGTGSETHAYIDHGTGNFKGSDAETLVKLMVRAVTDRSPEYTLQSVYDSAP